MTDQPQPMLLVADASALVALLASNATMLGVYQMAEREQAALILPVLPIAVATATAGASGEGTWEAILLPPGVYQTGLSVAGAVELAHDLLASHPDASIDDAQIWQTAWEARELGVGARVLTAVPERYKFLRPPGVITI